MIIISVILIALAVVLVFLLLATQAAVPGTAVELIALAEKTGATGPEKMAQVVASLSQSIPAVMRKVFTEPRLQAIAQGVFVWMRKYAQAYQAASQAAQAEATEAEINSRAIGQLIGELLDMGASRLKEKATAYGIDVTGCKTERDYAEAIITGLLVNAVQNETAKNPESLYN